MPGSDKIYLIAHPKSYLYIQSFVESMQSIIGSITGENPEVAITKEIESFKMQADSIALVIGDGFPIFKKQPGCLYGFINFSVIYYYRDLYPDKRAKTWISQKYRNYLLRLNHYDFMLEYDPIQYSRLKDEFPEANILRFLPTAHVHNDPITYTSEYDIGFVGNHSRRRKQLLDKLRGRGYSISPHENVKIGDTVTKSRLFLNIHMFRCLTSEPRIIEALTYGACLISERRNRYPLDELFMHVTEAGYYYIPGIIKKTLNNQSMIDQARRSSREYMKTEYAFKSKKQWIETLDKIFKIAQDY